MLFLTGENEQVNIRVRKQLAAAIPASRDQGDTGLVWPLLALPGDPQHLVYYRGSAVNNVRNAQVLFVALIKNSAGVRDGVTQHCQQLSA